MYTYLELIGGKHTHGWVSDGVERLAKVEEEDEVQATVEEEKVRRELGPCCPFLALLPTTTTTSSLRGGGGGSWKERRAMAAP